MIVFINKLDREGKDAFDLLDEVEQKLGLAITPLSFPIGMGYDFKGIYNLYERNLNLFDGSNKTHVSKTTAIEEIQSEQLDQLVGSNAADTLRENLELVEGVYPDLDRKAYLDGTQQPVFFGSALNNFGVRELLDCFIDIAPAPRPKAAEERVVNPEEEEFSGFVFKIHANMDPKHRDRIAFLRVCSGAYKKGMKIKHTRIGKDVRISDAVTFLAGDRASAEEAYPGDILGLHNHGTIQIGDTFTEGEDLQFTGIPHFAPELFRRVRLKDPLKTKQLQKGLTQLSEEGATQVFMPYKNNDLIVGAVGVLQFDVVAFRLLDEYKAEAVYDQISVHTARWIKCDDPKMLADFKKKAYEHLADDGGGYLTYLAPSRANLQLMQERWPDVQFLETREH